MGLRRGNALAVSASAETKPKPKSSPDDFIQAHFRMYEFFSLAFGLMSINLKCSHLIDGASLPVISKIGTSVPEVAHSWSRGMPLPFLGEPAQLDLLLVIKWPLDGLSVSVTKAGHCNCYSSSITYIHPGLSTEKSDMHLKHHTLHNLLLKNIQTSSRESYCCPDSIFLIQSPLPC